MKIIIYIVKTIIYVISEGFDIICRLLYWLIEDFVPELLEILSIIGLMILFCLPIALMFIVKVLGG